MTKKRPKINLSRPVQPRHGELERLFTGPDDVEQSAGMQLLAVRLDAIQPDPLQPRRTFPEEGLRELSESIQQDGIIQPIELTETRPNHYIIVHGERRWRAALLAGLEVIPAVVRRQDYDEVTRFVRQLVENIQREDLNDVDRAAGLIRLRDLMDHEVKQLAGGKQSVKNVSWSKVGQRLGYSRQRIHQLIQLLNLPNEVKKDVRDGRISERDTRIYQGMKPSQVRALHKARLAGEVSTAEAKDVARMVKANPDYTVYQALRLLRQPDTADEAWEIEAEPGAFAAEATDESSARATTSPPLGDLAPGGTKVTDAVRLSYVRQHLARIRRQGLTKRDQAELLRLLRLVEQDVQSLIQAIEGE